LGRVEFQKFNLPAWLLCVEKFLPRVKYILSPIP
jgi:hypothetical protein